MTPKARVVLYTKTNCGLCVEMKEQIRLANCPQLYTFEEVDIEGDPNLFSLYRYEIPVLCIDGIEAFRHRLTSDAFKAYLTSHRKD